MNKPTYAEVGSSTQQVGGSKPNGWVEMNEQRPSANHIAQSDGTWLDMTNQHLVQQIPALRYAEESKGVTINGIRYAGDESNRQALREAIDHKERKGETEFKAWKDSDGQYHANHPLSEVKDAFIAIGDRREDLIAKEGEFVKQIMDGTLTDIENLDWTV